MSFHSSPNMREVLLLVLPACVMSADGFSEHEFRCKDG